MARDPVLDIYIEPPRPFWRRRMVVVLPLLSWLLLLALVMARGLTAPTVDLVGELACMAGVGIVLILLSLPMAWRALLGNIAALRARRPAREAGQLLGEGNGRGAEALLRTLLQDARLQAPGRAGLVHALGVALLTQGDAAGGLARVRHARESGWLDSFIYRRPRALQSQGLVVASGATGAREEARAALAQARASQRPASQGAVELAAILLHSRAGEHAEAVALGRRLSSTGVALGIWAVGRLAAAMAAEALGEEEEVRTLLEGVHLAPGEPAWAARCWPELCAFALRRGVAASPIPTED